ncbi:MAG: hypothetical protein HY791_10755 [Deltaproteobacteria bacterium]|nr:hypothetical protein [Deltaproteobacteria bacterium]
MVRTLVVGLLLFGSLACEEERNRSTSRRTTTDGGPRSDGGPHSDLDAGATDAGDEVDGGTRPSVSEVDPACLDGLYTESLPMAGADIDSDVASYQPTAVRAFILTVLEKRYPIGKAVVEGGLANTRLGDCIDQFLQPSSSANEVARQLSTIVHECGHFFDLGQSGFDDATYVITPTLRFQCSGGSSRGTPARSLINDDELSSLRAPCGGRGSFDCDSYADIYLDGDPNDGRFDSGDQGFDMLLEETVQYVNSLASGYALSDRYVGSVSERDGILTFLWYVGRYLKMTREDHPAAYLKLSEDSCWRRAILTVWGRAWLYLEATEGDPALGIADRTLIALVRDARILDEIQRLRVLEGCEAP